MMLFLGILAIITGGVLWVVALVALGFMAMEGGVKAAVGIAGMILLLTTTTWVAVTTINHYAPYTMCGASNIQEDS